MPSLPDAGQPMAVIDRAYVAALRAHVPAGEAVFREAADHFINQMHLHLRRLDAALHANDHHRLQQVAQALQAAAAAIGLARLSQTLGRMLTILRDGGAESLRQIVVTTRAETIRGALVLSMERDRAIDSD